MTALGDANRIAPGAITLQQQPTTPAVVDLLLQYAQRLRLWNRRFNLISRGDEEKLVSRHLLDSLILLPFIDRQPIIDLGSGAATLLGSYNGTLSGLAVTPVPEPQTLAMLLAGWMQQQAIAVGVLDLPADERLGAAPVELAGWAIDPRGIAAVTLVHADGSRQPLLAEPVDEFSGIFGRGVGRHAVRFRGRIDAAVAGLVQVEVQPQAGAATVIDRRYLR